MCKSQEHHDDKSLASSSYLVQGESRRSLSPRLQPPSGHRYSTSTCLNIIFSPCILTESKLGPSPLKNYILTPRLLLTLVKQFSDFFLVKFLTEYQGAEENGDALTR